MDVKAISLPPCEHKYLISINGHQMTAIQIQIKHVKMRKSLEQIMALNVNEYILIKVITGTSK